MGTKNQIALQFAGIEFLPPDLFLDDAATVRHLLESAHSGHLDLEQLPFPMLPIRQIFSDQQKDHYLVIPTDSDSPLALPYITGSELGTLANTNQGGFMPVEQLIKASSPTASSSSTFPDPAVLIGQLTTELAKSLAKGESVGGAVLGQLQSQLVGLALSQIPEQFRGIAGEAISEGLEKAPQLLNDLMRSDTGGSMKNLLGDLNMGNVASMAAGGLVGQGFNKLADTWKVDDNSNTLEHVAHQYGMEALGEVKKYVTDELKKFVEEAVSGRFTSAANKLSNGFGNTLGDLGKKFDLFFNGMKSNAVLPAAYITSKDNKADVVITGFPTVFVDGRPISRITDLLEPSKKIILEGAATVLTGGLPVGRVTSDTAIPSGLTSGAITVLVGGPSVKISTPLVSKGVIGSEHSGTQAIGNEILNDSTNTVEAVRNTLADVINFINNPMFPFNKRADGTDHIFYEGDNKLICDRIFDPDRGFSSTLEEYNSLINLPGWLRNMFRMDADGTTTLGISAEKGHWYLFGGLIDLGSPEMPGAGTGFTWWVPDRILWMDMSNYFVYHDRHFNPTTLSNLDKDLSVELEAFRRGLTYDPMHISLQVLYSFFTTSVALGTAASNSVSDLFKSDDSNKDSSNVIT